ncbi:MAG TPA: copper chaperone PCu(A)C [Pseudolabrys sp.]|nr:copper chaperone PCu(A)C [Pseudolabrys sp.]
MTPFRILLGLSLAALVATPLLAQEAKIGDLRIEKPWSRATPGGAKIGGGYLTIVNDGASADRLIAVTSSAAAKVEIHEMSMQNGVMHMQPVKGGITVEPRKTVALAPGGYHLMLMNLKAPLKQGDKVPVTLEFEKAGKVNVTLDVQGIGAQTPAGGNGH